MEEKFYGRYEGYDPDVAREKEEDFITEEEVEEPISEEEDPVEIAANSDVEEPQYRSFESTFEAPEDIEEEQPVEEHVEESSEEEQPVQEEVEEVEEQPASESHLSDDCYYEDPDGDEEPIPTAASTSSDSDYDTYDDFDTFEPVAKIKVIGVGGAGNNAVNRMIDEEISNVEFYVMNTDKQALSTSKSQNRLVLGGNKYRGLGAGGDPRIGAEAAELSEKEIRNAVKGADMVFIAAGEGGGTGTGASPIVARIAKEEGALTVAIVTRPFNFEGKRRISYAVQGLNKLKEHVDSIIVVSNDKLLMMNGDSSIMNAFAESDKVLAQSVKTVSDLILLPGIINLDFADIRNTLKNAGVALIGFGHGKGANKVHDAASSAISSPLLEASIKGANTAIISVTCGTNVTLYDAQDAANEICEAAGNNLDMKYGVNFNPNLTDEIIISVIATDFSEEYDFAAVPAINPMRTFPRREEQVEEEKVEEEDNESSVIPSYLKRQG